MLSSCHSGVKESVVLLERTDFDCLVCIRGSRRIFDSEELRLGEGVLDRCALPDSRVESTTKKNSTVLPFQKNNRCPPRHYPSLMLLVTDICLMFIREVLLSVVPMAARAQYFKLSLVTRAAINATISFTQNDSFYDNSFSYSTLVPNHEREVTLRVVPGASRIPDLECGSPRDQIESYTRRLGGFASLLKNFFSLVRPLSRECHCQFVMRILMRMP
ncbi:hypothetical protein F5888DRAFT_235353 [Russula emetica]|nr:hypothetical protein F5888DRAFT_235353 [Russula emetica]